MVETASCEPVASEVGALRTGFSAAWGPWPQYRSWFYVVSMRLLSISMVLASAAGATANALAADESDSVISALSLFWAVST